MTTIYKIGTASVTNGSDQVVGIDTGWELAAVAGGILVINGYSALIESVEDDTHLTLAQDWDKATIGGVYAIQRPGDGLFIVDLDRPNHCRLEDAFAGRHPSQRARHARVPQHARLRA